MPATAPLRHLKECRQRKCNTGEIPHATLRKSICIFEEKVLAKNTRSHFFKICVPGGYASILDFSQENSTGVPPGTLFLSPFLLLYMSGFYAYKIYPMDFMDNSAATHGKTMDITGTSPADLHP